MADIAEQYFSLPAGTRVEEYELVSVIGHGSFGITYLAEDTNLGTRLAIKEYLPSDWAVRDSTQTVRAKNTGLSETLERIHGKAHLAYYQLWSGLDDRRLALSEHRKVFEAMVAGDAAGADQAARNHIIQLCVRLSQHNRTGPLQRPGKEPVGAV